MLSVEISDCRRKRKDSARQVLWVDHAIHWHDSDQPNEQVSLSKGKNHHLSFKLAFALKEISHFDHFRFSDGDAIQGKGDLPLRLFRHKLRFQNRLGGCLSLRAQEINNQPK